MATYYVATTGNDTTGDGSSGNPYASPGKAATVATIDGDKIFVKLGTYTLTTTTPGAAGPVVLAAGVAVLLEGYETTIGDLGAAPVIDCGAQTEIVAVKTQGAFSTGMQQVVNIKVDGQGGAGNAGFFANPTYCDVFYRCIAYDCPVGFDSSNATGYYAIQCQAELCGIGFTAGSSPSSGMIQFYACVARDCTAGGFDIYANSPVGGYFIRCVSVGNGGDGFKFGYGAVAFGCTAYNNTGDGFDSTYTEMTSLSDCVSYGNGGYGFNLDVAETPLVNCFGGSNSSGNCDKTLFRSSITNLTADPFASESDLRPNSTAGGGAVLRAAGLVPIGQSGGNNDIGAVQHADPAGGGGVINHPGMDGGLTG